MELQTVTSSNISRVGYDNQTMDMMIEFKDGNIYRFESVPEVVYNELLNAKSMGAYFFKAIRPNYRAEKLKIES